MPVRRVDGDGPMNAPEQRLEPEQGGAEDAHIQALIEADSREAVSARWLAWLAGMLPGVRRSFVLLDGGSNTLVTAAVRPDGVNPDVSRALVLQAITQRSPAARPTSAGQELAFPIVLADRVRGVVGIELAGADAAALARVTSTVQWGMGWLRTVLGDAGVVADAHSSRQLGRARQAVDLALSLMAEPGFKPAAMSLANLLCRQLQCELVQVGWVDAGSVKLAARSNSAWHDGRTSLVRLAEQAMDEALDQGLTLALPDDGGAAQPGLSATRALDAYRRSGNADAVLVVPMRAQGQSVGALLLERSHPFDDADIDTVEALNLLAAPLLQLKHASDESVPQHLRRKWAAWAGWLTGSRHLGWKLLATTAMALLLVAALLPVAHRISAPAVIEGETQRAAVAPFAGYLRSAPVRAGDTVKAGQLLARLDDKDLQLERVRWESELEVATRKEREAMSGADRVAMRLAAAQAAQAQAQLDLVNAKLLRVDIIAPFDAVLVKGDLSQMLGSPVESGKVLFELAPLNAWRVILKVDERDVALLQAGQKGELVLASLPGQSFELQTQRVLSTASAEEGRNYFRVEAALNKDAARLRPGMEGVAKVGVGEASLLWTWTHRLTDWLRRTAWEWSP